MKLSAILVACAAAFLSVRADASLSQGEIPDALLSAFVRVELRTQSSRGDNPPVPRNDDPLTERSGNFTATAGYLVAPDLVITPDFNMPPRFVREWRVTRGTDAGVIARPVAWAADRNAMLLKLSSPLPGTRPLDFPPDADTKSADLTSCFIVKHSGGIVRNTTIEPLSPPQWYAYSGGKRHRPIQMNSLIVTDAGIPVGFAFADPFRADDDTLKIPWREWSWIYEDDAKARLEKLSSTVATALIQTDITLRPLPVRAGETPSAGDSRSASDDVSAKPVPAIVLSPRRVLILAYLAPAETARLENVTLRLPGDIAVNARFIASVATVCAFVVEPEHDLEAPLILPDARPDWITLRNRLFLTFDQGIQGDTLIARPGIVRIRASGYSSSSFLRFNDLKYTRYLFDFDGNFIGCSLRSRFTNGNAADYTEVESAFRMGIYASETRSWADSNNIPRDEAGERRLIWLGVELQPLTSELAREKGVFERTQNGSTGGLVTKVYPKSPAERARLQPGDVLLRMRPINSRQYTAIRASNNDTFAMQILTSAGEIPDNIYDRIPPPWPPADSLLNQTLKRMGLGKNYELEYARDGKFLTARFAASQGPRYYGNAPEAIIATAGLNVKALTYETRAFYKIPDGDTALIVSRVVAGSRASIAGLRPYDLIVEVNDQPITTPDAFSELAKTGGKLRLVTRRMSQTRIITLDTE